jgi:hypothetical protein
MGLLSGAKAKLPFTFFTVARDSLLLGNPHQYSERLSGRHGPSDGCEKGSTTGMKTSRTARGLVGPILIRFALVERYQGSKAGMNSGHQRRRALLKKGRSGTTRHCNELLVKVPHNEGKTSCIQF